MINIPKLSIIKYANKYNMIALPPQSDYFDETDDDETDALLKYAEAIISQVRSR